MNKTLLLNIYYLAYCWMNTK